MPIKRIIPVLLITSVFTQIISTTLSMDVATKDSVQRLPDSMAQNRSSKLLNTSYDFTQLINTNQKERTEIHLFWTTGKPYDLLSDEYGAGRVVNIGGANWGKKFGSYIRDFLSIVPKNISVIFICDQLTDESNKPTFDFLGFNFGDRFQLKRWEQVTKDVYAKLPHHESNLKPFFEQGLCGNPAIASDVYRLVCMPLFNDEVKISFEKIMWTYTDVDTFCYAMENDRVSDYIKSIIETKEGSFFYKPSSNNDVIKLGFKDIESYDYYLNYVIKKLAVNQSIWCKEIINPTSYMPILFSYLKKNDFNTYIKEYKTDTNAVERKIMRLTGPYFADTLEGWSFFSDFPHTCSLEWNIGGKFTESISGGYLGHIYTNSDEFSYNYNDKYELNVAFDKYLPHLCSAINTKRFGSLHPFNINLLKWLKNNNPYMSEEYKRLFEEIKNKKNQSTVDLRDRLNRIENAWSSDVENNTNCPAFYRIRAALRLVGVEFPIIPVDFA